MRTYSSLFVFEIKHSQDLNLDILVDRMVVTPLSQCRADADFAKYRYHQQNRGILMDYVCGNNFGCSGT